MAKRAVPIPKRPQYRRTFIRQWREHRKLTLETLAERIGDRLRALGLAEDYTHATLSRLERGLVRYEQPILEAIADALNTDVASLLMRDPTDSEALWTVWEHAAPGEREKIVEVAKTITRKTGT